MAILVANAKKARKYQVPSARCQQRLETTLYVRSNTLLFKFVAVNKHTTHREPQ